MRWAAAAQTAPGRRPPRHPPGPSAYSRPGPGPAAQGRAPRPSALCPVLGTQGSSVRAPESGRWGLDSARGQSSLTLWRGQLTKVGRAEGRGVNGFPGPPAARRAATYTPMVMSLLWGWGQCGRVLGRLWWLRVRWPAGLHVTTAVQVFTSPVCDYPNGPRGDTSPWEARGVDGSSHQSWAPRAGSLAAISACSPHPPPLFCHPAPGHGPDRHLPYAGQVFVCLWNPPRGRDVVPGM